MVTDTVKVGAHPYCAAASADNIYVTNTEGDTVSVIDAATHRVTGTIKVGSVPEGIAYAAATNQIYVASWGDDNVSVIDASNNKLITQIATGAQSRAFGQFIAAAPH